MSRRCRECNVDLAESSRKCPLCCATSFEDEVKIKSIKEAPYPEKVPVVFQEKVKKPATQFTFEKIKAYFNL